MRKGRIVVIGLIAVLLIALLSGIGSAWFTDQSTTIVKGKTGYVKICSADIKWLVTNFQPGDTQYISIPLHNQGRCPVLITTKITGLPVWLRASLSPFSISRLNAGQTKVFRLYVYMPTTVGNKAQNKSFQFRVEFYATNLPTAH